MSQVIIFRNVGRLRVAQAFGRMERESGDSEARFLLFFTTVMCGNEVITLEVSNFQNSQWWLTSPLDGEVNFV